jgi:hypothetical protein
MKVCESVNIGLKIRVSAVQFCPDPPVKSRT